MSVKLMAAPRWLPATTISTFNGVFTSNQSRCASPMPAMSIEPDTARCRSSFLFRCNDGFAASINLTIGLWRSTSPTRQAGLLRRLGQYKISQIPRCRAGRCKIRLSSSSFEPLKLCPCIQISASPRPPSSSMAPLPHLSSSDGINIVGVVISFIGVVMATGFAYASLRLQTQSLRRTADPQMSDWIVILLPNHHLD
ncbi:uncharacterized protein BKA78DRAFT_172613 [Phyllosticta capitalensis]|uniref:uncharacterized protein n=1 Tax=Phyllosticta capitalensis TaxID=121624 RepID=UPI00312FE7BF